MTDVEVVANVLVGQPPRIIEYKPSADVTLTVSGGATPSAQSKAIQILGVAEFSVTLDHNRTGSNSTNLDMTVYTSNDGSTWDTEPYITANVGAAKRKTVRMAPPNTKYIRWKVENKDAVNATKVLPIVTIREW